VIEIFFAIPYILLLTKYVQGYLKPIAHELIQHILETRMLQEIVDSHDIKQKSNSEQLRIEVAFNFVCCVSVFSLTHCVSHLHLFNCSVAVSLYRELPHFDQRSGDDLF